MRIVSWNVNGLRACAKKGFLDALARSEADILGIQEMRAFESQLPDEVRSPAGWHTRFVAAERAGYSGIGLFTKTAPDRSEDSLGEPRFDAEGRYQLARFGRTVVVNAYFPNGSGKERDNSRVPYKLDFYRAVFDRVERLRRRYHVFVIGDWNTAHTEIDLARPAANRKTSGFLPEECAEMDRWLAAGWVDTFRQAPSRRDRALHLVGAEERGAGEERRVAHRLRARLARRDAAGAGCVHLAAGGGLGPLPDRGRRRGLRVGPGWGPAPAAGRLDTCMVCPTAPRTGREQARSMRASQARASTAWSSPPPSRKPSFNAAWMRFFLVPIFPAGSCLFFVTRVSGFADRNGFPLSRE